MQKSKSHWSLLNAAVTSGLLLGLMPGNVVASELGTKPTKKSPLTPYEKSWGYKCPSEKFFLPERRSNDNSDRSLGFDEFNYKIIFNNNMAKSFYTFKETSEGWTARPKQNSESSTSLTPFQVKIELLVSKSQKSRTKESLELIAKRFASKPTNIRSSYRLHTVGIKEAHHGRPRNTFILKNSDDKSLEIIGPDLSGGGYKFISGTKTIIGGATVTTTELYCTDTGKISQRTVSILNDEGEKPGQMLDRPSMVLILETFFEADQVQQRPTSTNLDI